MSTVYYKKHATALDVSSPASHFLKFDNLSTTQKHREWLEDIRQTIAYRTTYDNEMIPALYFHWKRTCWTLDKNNMHLEPIDQYGWTLENNTLCVIWDTPENMQAVRDRLNILLKGCKLFRRLSVHRLPKHGTMYRGTHTSVR